MEIVSAIVGPVVNALTEHITLELRNITSSAKRVREMREKMVDLEVQRVDIERHVEENEVNDRETPEAAEMWLKKYKRIKEDIDKISSDDIGCFNLRKKYRTGKNALTHINTLEHLLEERQRIDWRDNQRPLGRVDSKRGASTSTSGGNTQIQFESREKIFNDALKFLEDDDKTRVIALSGMGGVGKTTLMKQLKEAAKHKKMFKYIAEVAIGNTPNLLSVQKAIAAHIRDPEIDETLLATYLSKTFKVRSERKEKVLVILDDVWEKINLEDIGLAPFPNGVKLLLTSRNVHVCRQIAVDVDANSVLGVVQVDVLKEDEARSLFCQIAGISEEHERDLYHIGSEIVKKCGCLPLAIKVIAAALKCQEDFVWRSTLDHLKINDLDKDVQEIFKISCDNLKPEDKAIFLLCGLFPEDSNISIEDLTRYAWGLKLLKQVSSMGNARDRTRTSVRNLKNAYLLMDGDSRHTECVKMHDLVLAFVAATVSKGGEEGCWIIGHDDFSNLSEDFNVSQSCKCISLACEGMSDQFPSEFKFPNLSLLKLMHGNELLRFPLDFYEGMKKVEVIAFQKLEYPVVPTSFQCSTNLRTLCLDECSLMFDLTCIGFLSNLEVLSFANSGITILPSTFGNLKKLRLLDATGCYNLIIEDDVLKNMVKLEELYMIAFDKKACCFTDNNCNELAVLSEHLSVLELELIGYNAHLKNMSFKKLNRFKLAVGCSFGEVKDNVQKDQVDMQSYEKSLKLVTKREELVSSKINELFKMTDALYLQVNDMNTLEHVDVQSQHPRHHPRKSSFDSLRFLVVSECVQLICLFTMNVATSLSKLEYLDISGCPVIEAVIDTENDESDIIKFSNLKYLRLAGLPKLSSFCDKANVIELPCLVELQLEGLQSFTSIYPSSANSFFHEEDATPKLEKLFVSHMENLKEIWPPQFSISNLCPLRELTVEGCGSIEVLFNIDMGGVGEIEELVCSSSLRSIKVKSCDSLVKLFSCNPFPFLINLQELKVESCGSIQVLFGIDLGCAGKSEEQVCNSSLRSIVVEDCDSLVNLFPVNLMALFNHLEELTVRKCASVEVIFDIDMGCVGETDKVSSSRLRRIDLRGLRKLREVWRIKDAGNNLIHGFESVESIRIGDCERFENLITPTTTNIEMRALKQVEIIGCGGESERNNEMVESKQDQEIDVVPIPGKVSNGDISKVAFPSSYLILHTFHHLRQLVLWNYKDVEVVFEIMNTSSRESPHNTQQPLILPYLEVLQLKYLERMSHMWKCNWNEFLILQKPQSLSSFHNLTTITMYACNSIKYLFSPLMAKLLSNLKKVDIMSCDGIEEVVSDRDDEDASIYPHTTTTFFPRLDILKLKGLINFRRIGGVHDQLKLSQPSSSWSLCQYAREISITDCDVFSSVIPWYVVGQMQKLQVLKIKNCKSMTEVFETQEVNNKSGSDTGKSLPRLEYITMLKLPKLKILKIQGCHLLKHIFTFSTLESLAELEELEIENCEAMEVIVKKDNGEQTEASDVVVFPRLKSLALVNLPTVVGFFLGKNEFTWPALKKVVISECPQITVFTYGRSTTPELKFINSSLGKHSIDCGLNFRVMTTSHQARLPIYEILSYNNLIGVDIRTIDERNFPFFFSRIVRKINYYRSGDPETLFPSDKLRQLQKLETVNFGESKDTKVIFDSQTVEAEIPNLRQVELRYLKSLKYIWKSKQGTVLKFPNLTRLYIKGCGSLEYVFTCSMVGSILQLQKLHISGCDRMKVIVKGEEEECDAIGNATVVFPRLKSLTLEHLEGLEGFCLGKEAFEFPSLDTLEIERCYRMKVFTKGDLSAPKLYAINTRWYGDKRKYNIHNRLNSVIINFTKRD